MHAPQAAHQAQVVGHPHLAVQGRGLGQVADAEARLDRAFEDVVAGDAGTSRAGRQVAGEDAHGRGLSRAVGTEEPQDLPAGNRKSDVRDREPLVVVLGQPLDFDHAAHHSREGPAAGGGLPASSALVTGRAEPSVQTLKALTPASRTAWRCPISPSRRSKSRSATSNVFAGIFLLGLGFCMRLLRCRANSTAARSRRFIARTAPMIPIAGDVHVAYTN